jgi:hypothetical protein
MNDRADPVVRSFRPKQDDVVPLAEFLANARFTPEHSAPAPRLAPVTTQAAGVVPEIGGRKNGLDPTRYGDWEKDGRCIDF